MIIIKRWLAGQDPGKLFYREIEGTVYLTGHAACHTQDGVDIGLCPIGDFGYVSGQFGDQYSLSVNTRVASKSPQF